MFSIIDVVANKIPDTDFFQVNIFRNERIIAGILTYEKDEHLALIQASSLIKQCSEPKKYVTSLSRF